MFYDDLEVLEAVDFAWRDSQPEERYEFHEEGGSIFWHSEIGEYSFERCAEGTALGLEYDTRRWPMATYHTHPAQHMLKSANNVGRGPSPKDIAMVDKFHLPMLIRDTWRLYLVYPVLFRKPVLCELRSYSTEYPMFPLWPWAVSILAAASLVNWQFDTTEKMM